MPPKPQTKFARKRGRSAFPTSDDEFFERFATEAACREYIIETRWPNGFECPKCGDGGDWIPSRDFYKCYNGHQISITCDTVMHRTRTPLRFWFYAAWLQCTHKPGVSALQLAERKIHAPGYMGIWGTLHKLRYMENQADTGLLSGYVEVDEMLVGGEEEGVQHRGRGAETKATVAVAVEFEPWQDANGVTRGKAGRCRLRVIDDVKGATMRKFIADTIESGATVHTDGSSSYARLPKMGYEHIVTVARYDADPLPTLGRVSTNLKRWLIGTHKGAVRKAHLQTYLNEFVFRFNSRTRPWDAFGRLLGLTAVTGGTARYRDLWKHDVIYANPSLPGQRKVAR